MEETEITKPQSPETEATSTGGDSRATIALSEENLLALLGSSSPVAVKPAKPSPVSLKPEPSQPSAPVEPTLARLSSVQTPVAESDTRMAPAPKAASPAPVATTPIAVRTVAPTVAAPAAPVATPRRVSATHPLPESVDNTLALIAAIKENRAGLLRSEAATKPAPQPVSAAIPAPQLAPPARVEQTTRRPEPAPTPVPAAAKTAAPPAPLSISERIDRHPAMPSSRNVVAPTGAPLPTQSFGAISAPESAIDKIPGGRITLLVAGAVIAVGGITTGLILRSHRAAPAPVTVAAAAPAPTAAPTNTFPLQLQLEPLGKGQVGVHWNPQSSLIAQSKEGRLVITENNQPPRTVPLTLDHLKSGRLTYQPQTDRVEFRLEVVDQSGSVAEESVLSVGTPVPLATAAQPVTPGIPPATAFPAASVAANPAAIAAAKIEAPQVPAAGAANANRTAARTFTPPQVNRAPNQNSIVDAPPEVNASTTAPSGLMNAQVPRAGAPPPPPPAAPAATPAPRQLQVESSLQAAKLIRKITPAYPTLAKSARVQGTVHFKATIGKDGSVQNLETLSGPSLLRQSAIEAVKQWKYQPTILNGQPMEVLTSIDVLFTISQ